ncbi:carbohydrate ABC transporter permease [Rhizobium cremeum]|uniref:carbohydrate ABC transporter permease n=1 Tax=Rhizobium cremeum TaxID=2813827 RepID=UPI000DD5D42B|nr:carbohydrate ABC transporter permease [Rhizobium cremeum]MCJ7995379.1 carbohydrate ABC transporter permease [Rhizobium cremeum]MCJ8000877.1 carbohydrate ABC transporter permease [Rhizobium cremeum]
MSSPYSPLRLTLVALVLLVFMLPPGWLLLSALKPQAEIFQWPPTLLPVNPTFENFANAISKARFLLFFQNSAIVAILSAMLSVTISVMAGYALAKFRFKGDTVLFMLIMSSLMVPLQIVLIPVFLVLRDLGLLNTLAGLIIAPAATPTGVFLMRQYIVNIPDSLLEAARLDGTPEWRILLRIIVPLSIPAIGTLMAFNLVWRWNDYLWPFLIVNDQDMWTVQMAIANSVGRFGIDWPRLLSMSVLSVLPVLVVFSALQRLLMGGIMAGATKE